MKYSIYNDSKQNKKLKELEESKESEESEKLELTKDELSIIDKSKILKKLNSTKNGLIMKLYSKKYSFSL